MHMHIVRRLSPTKSSLLLAALSATTTPQLALCQDSTTSAKTQPSAPPLPAFEVATIKPLDPNASGMMGFYSYPGGRILLGAASLRTMVYYAFDIPMNQIAGGPDWIDKDRYNIVARPPAASKSATAKQPPMQATPSNEQRQMLQSLLAERFGFKFHREIKEGPVYILTKGNNKLQMQDAKDKDGYIGGAIFMQQGGIVDGSAYGLNITMSYLASLLARHLERPVLDQTGLTGSYDFHLDPDDPTNTDMPTAVSDVVKRLGLNLKAGKGPIETIVIDNATKPTEN